MNWTKAMFKSQNLHSSEHGFNLKILTMSLYLLNAWLLWEKLQPWQQFHWCILKHVQGYDFATFENVQANIILNNFHLATI